MYKVSGRMHGLTRSYFPDSHAYNISTLFKMHLFIFSKIQKTLFEFKMHTKVGNLSLCIKKNGSKGPWLFLMKVPVDTCLLSINN